MDGSGTPSQVLDHLVSRPWWLLPPYVDKLVGQAARLSKHEQKKELHIVQVSKHKGSKAGIPIGLFLGDPIFKPTAMFKRMSGGIDAVRVKERML